MSDAGEQSYEQKFSTSDLKHEMVRRFEPKFLGLGGQYVVYEAENYPNSVIKVQARTILESVRHNKKNDEKRRPEDFDEKLEVERGRFRNLQEFFGREHTLGQKFYGMNIPINERLLRELNNRYSGLNLTQDEMRVQDGDEVSTIVSIQEKSLELPDKSRISVTSGYSEESKRMDDPDFRRAYDAVTTEAVIDLTSNRTISAEDLAVVHPHLGKLIARAESDPAIHTQLRDFVRKSIGYSRMYGETLDLAGNDNVIFFKNDNGEWNYKLIDALFPSAPPPEGKIEQTKRIIANAVEEGVDTLNPGDRNVLINTLNYVRVINGLGNYLGEEGRINIIPDGVNVTTAVLLEASKPLSDQDVEKQKRQHVDYLVDSWFPGVEEEFNLTPGQIAGRIRADKLFDQENPERAALVDHINGGQLTKSELVNLLMER